MNKYGLHGTLKAKPGNRDELARVLLEAAKLVSPAKGCQQYFVSIDSNDSNAIWVTEVWDSKEDHDNALSQQNVKALIAQALPLLEGKPGKGQELHILGGKGISHAKA